MAKLKRFLYFLVILILTIGIGAFIFVQHLKPDYRGEKTLPQLTNEVNVYFDNYGVPHIYAQNQADAFKVLGYVHAQDRLWQMELLRRIGTGRLSEVFGPDMLQTDKFFLALGIDEATEYTVKGLDHESEAVKLSEAYLKGINQFIADGPTPIEFYLTGIKKEPYTLKDILNTIGYMAFSFAQAHKTDPLLTEIRQKLGDAYLQDPAVHSDSTTVWIKNFDQRKKDSLLANVSALVQKSLKQLPVPLFEGSNSWVIAPQKTKNGKVILANDPHIGFAQPSVWYEAHIVTPDYEKYGFHLGGVPFPMLAHDRHLAYGLTMFENDDIDFYFEETHPSDTTKYKTENGWMDYEYVSKTIPVKAEKPVSFTYKKSRHGPVLNGIAKQITGKQPMAMSWVYTQMENRLLNAVYGMCHAKNLNEFEAALPNIHAPGLNVMYGDAMGNIAWWASAQLYHIPDSVDTKQVRDGSQTKGFSKLLDFSENPHAINPPWGYVYSANNQPDSIAGILYPGYYLPENRAKRIVELLESKNDWDYNSVSEMLLDDTSSVNPSIVTQLSNALNVKELEVQHITLLDRLKAWKGDYPLEDTNGAFFHRWLYQVMKGTFHDELGDTLFTGLLSTHLLKRTLAPMVATRQSVWWDDITTTDKTETREDIVQQAFLKAYASLEEDLGHDSNEWRWEKVHTLEHPHPIGQVKALRSFFNVGPFPVAAGREVINNMGFPYTDDGFFRVSSGPSTRRIIDFSDVENSMGILPTGQSGNPFSPHYKNQAEMYVKGEFRKMIINKGEIEKSDTLLTFKR